MQRSRRARLPIEEVKRLYTVGGWSTEEIGARFGVSRTTVSRHLREAGVRIHRAPGARQLTGRRPCSNSVVFRAYALGLVWGDFSAERQGPGSVTIRVRSSTTQPEQVQLARETFEAFGPVTYRGHSLYISLDLSFSFLQEKYEGVVPSWIRGSEASAAFAAGYVDAEGSFGVYEGRARCKIDAYDEAVLRWLHAWSRRIGVRSRLRCIARQGDPRGPEPPFQGDLWRLNVNDGPSLLRFIATLDPYLRHVRRRADAEAARQNILQRLRSRIGDQQVPLLCTSQSRGSWEEHAC